MSEEIRTFDGAIENFKRWSEIQFEETFAGDLIDHCLLVHRSPSAAPELWKLWQGFRYQEQAKIRRYLDGANWAETDEHALYLLGEGWVRIDYGIRHFLPEKFALGYAERKALWCWYLLVLGCLQRDQDDPYIYLRPSATFFMGGPYALNETIRRFKKYPNDTTGGIINYSWRSRESLLGMEEVISTGIEKISTAVRKRLPAKARERLDGESKDVLRVEVANTLFDKFQGTPEDILARGIGGKLGVISAAKNKVSDYLRFLQQKPIRQLLREAQRISRRLTEENREPTPEERRRLEQIPEEIDSVAREMAKKLADGDFGADPVTPEQ